MNNAIIQLLQTRPQMYLWASVGARFPAVVNWFLGYMLACQETGVDDELMLDTRFADWLLDSKGLKGARSASWPGILHASFDTDDERLEAFFRLYDEFVKADARSNRTEHPPTDIL